MALAAVTTHYLLLDGSADMHRLIPRLRPPWTGVICLCWMAPETVERLSHATGALVFTLADIPGGLEKLQQEMVGVTDRLCSAGQAHHGVPWADYIREPLYRELETVAIVRWAIDGILARSPGDAVEIHHLLSPGNLRLAEHILSIRGESGTAMRGLPDDDRYFIHPGGYIPWPVRLVRHARQVLMTGKWRIQVWNAIEKLDSAVRVRRRWWPRTTPQESGGVTFFSSYKNNTLMLLPFIERFPGQVVQWVVTTHYAAEAARQAGVQPAWLWAFKGKGIDAFEPDGNLDLSDIDPVISSWISETATWRHWKGFWHRSLASLADCWDGYLDAARPSAVVVASQWGIDGWFARQASQRGIRTVQVMHGVVGNPFFDLPLVTDELWVPGAFWRDRWPESERGKIHVHRPPGWFPATARTPGTGRLTFFSWPLHLLPSFNASELTDAFIGIFNRLAARGYRVQIHCHPLENPSDILRRWRDAAGPTPGEISVGKHRPTPDLLRETDVALMFRSTVMLDALASSVPVVMPGWIDLGLNQHLTGLRGIHLARDLADLERTLVSWLDRPPAVPEETRRRFVA